jgi:hypothetical protein
MEISKRLLLDGHAAGSQPGELGTCRSQLACLRREAGRRCSAWPPVSMLFNSEIPHESSVIAVHHHRPLLGRRWQQSVSTHVRTVRRATDKTTELPATAKW